MAKASDIKVVAAKLYFLPVATRVPLKFGAETLTSITCARVCLEVEGKTGKRAVGWGETPLSVAWVWPSELPFNVRENALKDFCLKLAREWNAAPFCGHALEIGADFLKGRLHSLLASFNAEAKTSMPHLAALVCCSAFDLALHDAYGNLLGRPVYSTYNREFLSRDLSAFVSPAEGADVSFAGKYPCDFLAANPPARLPVWHLVGGKDPLAPDELSGAEPDDGYPVLLRDWIERDGLKCLKIKLRGNDEAWDYERLLAVGKISCACGVDWLSTDFNCMVRDPAYVNAMLDRLMLDSPEIYGKILYVEQPFPYELAENRIDAHSVSARKPLFLDESAHDWELVRLGRSLGWTGVALKTCKTQTGALFSLCWAKAHGMTLMVQDLTNPMLALVPHALLAAHAGTIMGVECNAMQFYPDASKAEEKIHPGLYRRQGGVIDFSTVRGPGFGYRLEEIERELPAPVFG